MKISCKLEKWLSTLRSALLLSTFCFVQLVSSSTSGSGASFDVPNTVCEGTEVVFINTSDYSANDSANYKWIFEEVGVSYQTNGIVTWPIVNTTRQVKITLIAYLQNGDSSTTAKFIIVHPLPQADFTAEYVGNNCQLKPKNGMDIYIWEYGDGKKSYVQDPIIPWEEFDDSCEVCLTVKNIFCWDTRCQNICITIGVENISEMAKRIEIYPNPSFGEATLLIDAAIENPQIELLNGLGKHIQFSTEKIDSTIVKIKTYDITAGVYFVKVNGEGFSAVKKLVVQNLE